MANSRRRRQHHADDPGLGGGVGGLTQLALAGGDRGGRDDHSALAVVERLGGGHISGGQAQQIEAADQVDLDDLCEVVERHRPAAPDDALGRRDAGAVDQDSRRAMSLAGLPDSGLGRIGAGHVAGDAKPANLRRDRGRLVAVEVEYADLGAGLGQVARGLFAQSRTAAGDDGAMTRYIHISRLPKCPLPNRLAL